MYDITQGAFGKDASKKSSAIINVLFIIVVVFIVYKLYKSSRKGLESVGDTLGEQIISVQTGVPVARLAAIKAKAVNLWDNAVINPGWWSPWYDYRESMFVSAINSMANIIELDILDNAFRQQHANGTNLKGVIEASFDDTEIAQTNPIFYSHLKMK